MKRFNTGLVFLFLSLLLIGANVLTTEANEPTAVELRYFRAESASNGVKLVWETASEFDSSGFTIERATSANGTYQYLPNIGFVPSVGYEVGALYEKVDTSAILGQTYWYRLVDYDSSNEATTHEPYQITAGVSATATPIQIQTATPRPTNTPLPTLPPTNTPVATNTPLPNAPTNTPQPAQPTNTPIPNLSTNTPQPAQPTTAPPVATSTNNNNPTATAVNTENTNNSMPTATSAPDNNNSGTVDAAPQPTTDPNNSITTLAQVSPTPAADGYPAPTNNNQEPPPPLATELPEGYNDLSSPTNSNPVNPTNNQQLPSQNEGEKDNTGVLWAVFILSLLIFAGGVYGSIKLFNRQG